MSGIISCLKKASALLLFSFLAWSNASPALAAGTLYTVAQTGNIYKLDPDTGGVLGTLPSPGGSEWRGMAFGEGRLFFGQGTTIYELSLLDGAVINSFASPVPVDGLGFSGTELFVSSEGSATVGVLDPDTGAVIRTLTTTVALSGGLTFAGDRNVLYGSSVAAIYMLDPRDGTVLLSGGVAYPVEGLGYSASRGTLFYGTMINNLITELNPETYGTVGSFSAPIVCVGMAADEVIPNTPPVLDTNAGLTLWEGDAATIPNTLLAASDAEQAASEVTYTVTSAPANGTLYLDGTPLSGSPFTQQDIDDYLLSYWHDGSLTTSDSFSFQLTDGEDIAGPYTFNITVIPLDHTAPVSTIIDPLEGAVLYGNSYTVKVTADDSGGSGVATVEVSTDGGTTWHEATGYGTWSYDWTITEDGSYTILSRATDGMDNVETPGPGVSVTVDNTAPVSAVKTWGYNSSGQLGDWTTTNSNAPVKTRGIGRVDSVSAGWVHTAAVSPDGTVWAWGDNTAGQLGDGTNTSSGIPVKVSGLTGVSAVSARGNHTVALMDDGTVMAWGDNTYGQLGNATNTSSNTPVQVVMSDGFTPLTGVSAVAAGSSHTVALMEDGTVMAWGDNTFGQLGDGTNIPSNTPVTVLLSGGVIPLSSVDAVSAGDNHTVALMIGGTVKAWGRNADGQLGDGSNTSSSAPVTVSGLSGAVAVSAGINHTVALLAGGTVRSWGDNMWGQLGDGTNTASNVPVTVSGLSGVSAVSGGCFHTVALKNDRTVMAWGYNGMGSLGDGTNTDSKTPVQVKDLTDVTYISAGFAHTAVLTDLDTIAPSSSITYPADGATLEGLTYTITGTADDGSGSGVAAVEVSTDGGTTWRLAVDTSGSGGFGTWRYDWNIMAEGGYTILSRARDASDNREIPGPGISATVDNGDKVMPIKSWGENTYGELGNGTTTDSNTPVPVSDLAGAVAVSAGERHTVALMPDGTVRAWGDNTYGQLGDGLIPNSTTPVEVIGLTGVVAVDAGAYHTVALDSDGMVWIWGRNSDGQLGDGTYNDREYPYPLPDIEGAVAVSAGLGHTVALMPDGTVMAWGSNLYGQLGDGAGASHITPFAVADLTGVVGVSAGGYHTVAVKSDGTVWTWGRNDYGQLGNTSVTWSHTPVQVMLIDNITPLTGIVAVSAGDSHNLALTNNNEVMAWGRGDSGQLGYGYDVSSTSPVPVFSTALQLSGVAAVSAGTRFSAALMINGTLQTWGYNLNGQLGDGTNDNRNMAGLVSGLYGAANVSAGGSHVVALQCMPDTMPPVSEITAPFDGSVMPSGIYFYPVTGTVSDTWPGTGVTRVEVSADGGTTWEDAEPTDVNPDGTWNEWEYAWIVPGDGAFTIMSRATDMVGNVEAPGPGVTVFVDNTAPTSDIDSPAGGASLTGSVCTIAGTAYDGTGAGVLGVEVSTDGGATWNLAKGRTVWGYTWTLPANGDYNIRTRATDYSGNRETPDPGITVSVANSLATITLDHDSYSGLATLAFVTVVDEEANVTPGQSNDTVAVTVTTPTDPTGETVTLYENTPVPGEFFESFGFEPLRLVPGDFRVGISRGESITVSYIDNTTPSGTPEVVTDTASWDCGRALWVRNTDDLINDVGTARANLFAFCAAPHGNPDARIDTLYLAAYDAISANTINLEDFVLDAHLHYLRVECLVGDPSWATPAGLPLATDAVAAIRAYNDAVYIGYGWFDGIHFDVRPEELADWSTNMATIWADYKTMLSACYADISAPAQVPLALGVDIPDWYDTVNPGVVDSADVQDAVDYTVIKTLSDSSTSIIATTQNEVGYADSIGKKAYVGLETACGVYADAETFCEEGPAALDAEAALVDADNASTTSYLGVAVNDYDSYAALVRTELALESLTPDPAYFVTAGDTVVWTAVGGGGSGYYNYDFWLKNIALGNWTDVQPWSGADSWSWIPKTGDIGVWRVLCTVQDANDTLQQASLIAKYDVVAPPVMKSVEYDLLSPGAPGQTVTFTASASGGTWEYEYQFWLQHPDSSLTMELDYSASDSWSFTPQQGEEGSYRVLVYVRSAGSQAAYHDSMYSDYYDVVSGQAVADSIVIDPYRRITAGNTASFTLNASEGSGNYEYCVWRKNPDGSWTTMMDYPGSGFFTWNTQPGDEGAYKFLFMVRNAGATYMYDDVTYSGQYFVDP